MKLHEMEVLEVVPLVNRLQFPCLLSVVVVRFPPTPFILERPRQNGAGENLPGHASPRGHGLRHLTRAGLLFELLAAVLLAARVEGFESAWSSPSLKPFGFSPDLISAPWTIAVKESVSTVFLPPEHFDLPGGQVVIDRQDACAPRMVHNVAGRVKHPLVVIVLRPPGAGGFFAVNTERSMDNSDPVWAEMCRAEGWLCKLCGAVPEYAKRFERELCDDCKLQLKNE
jgi:hypothetical protein